MLKIAVIDQNKTVLEPCHPAVARRLLKQGKAAVFKRYPFTLILKCAVVDIHTTGYTLSVDPGSKCTGLVITDSDNRIVQKIELHHRGQAIKKGLSDRAGSRRSRRTRKLRHRPPRFKNRSRKSPRLTEAGRWEYEQVENTWQKKSTFNRISQAQLQDTRYDWVRIEHQKKTGELTRKKTRIYFAGGKRMREGDKYVEIDGQYHRFDEKTHHGVATKSTYNPKSPRVKDRWRRIFVGDRPTNPSTDANDKFLNGWIPPSLMSRVFNIETWVRRLCKAYPITQLAVEHVKFDTQKMENPEIEGVEYQQGTLHGYEVREYLLEKFKHKCYYCGKKGVPLDIDHIIPRGKDGTNRIDNLTIACTTCNQEKGSLHPNEWDIGGKRGDNARKALKAAAKSMSMKDAQAINTIRWKISETLKNTGMPVHHGTGGQTKYNRTKAGLPKTHYYDAASVSCVPVDDTPEHPVLAIHAVGYGHRGDLGCYQTKQTAPGFKQEYKRIEHSNGFAKLDMVEIHTRKGKSIGSLNTFDKTAEGKNQKLRIKTDWTAKDGRLSGTVTQLKRIQKRDGYAYQIK